MAVQVETDQNGYFVPPKGAKPPMAATVELVDGRKSRDLLVTSIVADLGSLARAIALAHVDHDNATK